MVKPTSIIQNEPWMPPLLPGLSKLTNGKGELYGDFRKKLKPNYFRIQVSILATFLYCLAITAVMISKEISWILLVIGVIPLSLLQLRLLNVIHEGAHYLLAPNRRANDLFCNVLAGWFFVVAVDQYRITHIEHHRNLGKTGDPENAHMDELDFTWLVSAFSGLRTIKTLLLRKKIRHDVTKEREKDYSPSHWLIPICGGLMHLMILGIIAIGGISFGDTCWVFATYLATPGLGMLRNLLEHRYVGNVDPSVWDALLDKPGMLKVTPATTRTFTKSILSQFYGSMGFTRHLLHHWDPSISFQNLKEVHNFVLESAIGSLVASTDSTFTSQFIALWRKA
jgi:fatty acid desaturase